MSDRARTFSVKAFVKRAFDIVVGTGMLLVFLPLCIAIAALIYCRHGGPVIFAHERVGRHGRSFRCLKFRTMRRDSGRMLKEILRDCPQRRREWMEERKLKDDPRILPGLGQFLRRSSLDELPQIWNVLRGDMSVVGPRPVPRDELHCLYGGNASYYVSVKPGLTGPWQVGGRNDLEYEERVALDVDYSQNWSVAGDTLLVAKTAKAMLRSRDGR